MPELPEVEITRRHLAVALEGRRIERVVIGHPRTSRLNASPEEVAARLQARSVISLDRHGKLLLGNLDDGQIVLAHLGMSGRFRISPPGSPFDPHTHAVITLDDGAEVRFVDPRTFGFVAVIDGDEVEGSPLSRLGPDAWERPPTVADLQRQLAGRSASIKALLLDQRHIAGLGNIYSDEALFHARVRPTRPAGRLGPVPIGRLLTAIREVLGAAIESGGTTLDDLAYLLPDGQAGDNLPNLAVYGREGLPCPACGTPVSRVVIRARSTHFCRRCQR
jgi:formamidopyrimidine-DNA glycosylase